MAILDPFVFRAGVAITNRQPSSGVFERISFIMVPGDTDGTVLYDGTDTVTIFLGNGVTGNASNNIPVLLPYNMCLIIGNTVYLRKLGTADVNIWCGVQVDT